MKYDLMVGFVRVILSAIWMYEHLYAPLGTNRTFPSLKAIQFIGTHTKYELSASIVVLLYMHASSYICILSIFVLIQIVTL